MRAVVSHHYGKEGRDSKQIETSGLIFDLEFFHNITSKDFITTLRSNIQQFVDYLNNNNSEKGKGCIIFLLL